MCKQTEEHEPLEHEYASNERKKFRTTSEADSMEADEHPIDFFSESDSDESDIDVGTEI